MGFFLGLAAALFTHLSANLINDYADSKSGADFQDKRFYQFFGGSKLIQEKIFTENFYLELAIFFVAISCISVIWLALILHNFSVIIYYSFIIFLGWSYSTRPIQFSYHRMGEVVIFLLFGPAPVMGGYFIQTGAFPDIKSFILSLPFGFFTTAILFANEIPDFPEDKKAGKFTWVGFLGPRKSFLLYYLIVACGFISILFGFGLGILGPVSLFAFLGLVPAVKAAGILRKHYADKMKLMDSSRLTIAVHTIVGIILILDMII